MKKVKHSAELVLTERDMAVFRNEDEDVQARYEKETGKKAKYEKRDEWRRKDRFYHEDYVSWLEDTLASIETIEEPNPNPERSNHMNIHFFMPPEDNDVTARCRGKVKTDKEGEYFGSFMINDMRWAVVLWDGQEDPNFYKATLLEVVQPKWSSI